MSFTVPLMVPGADAPSASYEVRRMPHGVAVFGPVPVDDFVGLARGWGERGWTLLDASISRAIGATLAAGSPESLRLWRAEIEEQATAKAGDDPELAWALGTDVGASAAAIAWVLAGSSPARQRVHRDLRRDDEGEVIRDSPVVPSDGDDAGRCVRLLDRFPEWRGRLGEVAKIFPWWRPYVARWGEIEAVYREEIAAGDGEGMPVDGDLGSDVRKPPTPRTDALVRSVWEEAREERRQAQERSE